MIDKYTGEEFATEHWEHSEELYKELNHYQKIAMLNILLLNDAEVCIHDTDSRIGFTMRHASAQDVRLGEKAFTVIARANDVLYTNYDDDDERMWDGTPKLGTIGDKKKEAK